MEQRYAVTCGPMEAATSPLPYGRGVVGSSSVYSDRWKGAIVGATASNLKHGKKARSAANGSSPSWIGFVDISLSAQDKADLETWSTDPVDVLGIVDALAGEGYKLSLSPDTEHNCVIATATGKTDACLNLGYSLSARGPDVSGALVCLWFKHTVLAKSGLWANVGTNRDNSRYG